MCTDATNPIYSLSREQTVQYYKHWLFVCWLSSNSELGKTGFPYWNDLQHSLNLKTIIPLRDFKILLAYVTNTAGLF